MVRSGRDLKRFMECFADNKRLAGDVVSRLILITNDNSYGGTTFYLHPLPGLTKSRFQFLLREEKSRNVKPRTWSLTMICDGKAELESQESGLGDADVLRKIVEIINQEGM